MRRFRSTALFAIRAFLNLFAYRVTFPSGIEMTVIVQVCKQLDCDEQLRFL
jgi:hypothetical protein